MSRNAVETVMGAVVLVVAAVFLFFAYTTSQVRAVGGGYPVTGIPNVKPDKFTVPPDNFVTFAPIFS